MQILCLKFFSRSDIIPFTTIYLVFVLFSLFFQVTSLIRWPFSWWRPPGTLCPLAALWTSCSLCLPLSCHPETSLSCALKFDTLRSGSHVTLLLSLGLLFIGTCPASQERDMGYTFSESPRVRKCPFLPSDFTNDLAFQVEDHVLSDF